ncbi:MAG: Hsp70 family protein [Anaerolineae bacterium]
MGKAIGIDLGTTNSVMAILKGDRAETIENLNGNPLTPSVVGIDSHNEFLVGNEAKNQAVLHPENTIFSIKRFMGRNFDDPDIQRDITTAPYKVCRMNNGGIQVRLGSQLYTPPEISSMILKAMKQEAEEQIGEVTHAVVTVPAYFGQRQKDATREAGRLAGLKVMRIIPEPTAAALAYGISAETSEPKTILVYDLGGGTFDVTVLLITGGVFTDLAKKGDNHLGGDDFDQLLINHVLTHLRRNNGVSVQDDREVLQKLKDKAEDVKIQLTKKARVPVVIPALTRAAGQYVDLELELTREAYEAMIRPKVQRTIDLVHEAIRASNSQPSDIDHILLVGGSTLTPLVRDMLRHEFGVDKILHGVNPMQCVALGAAIQTAIPSQIVCPHCKYLNEGEDERCQKCGQRFEEDTAENEVACRYCGKPNPQGAARCNYCMRPLAMAKDGQPVVLIETIPKPLGIMTVGDKMEPIITTDMFYPTREPVTRYFRTHGGSAKLLRAPVYEGFSDIASQNELLGEISGDLPPGLPGGTEVAISFYIDADGILYVTAQLPQRPNVKFEATIDWKDRQVGAALPDGNGGTTPEDWRDEAQNVLEFLAFTLERAERYLQHDPSTRKGLYILGTELQQAITQGNEAAARKKKAEVEEALNELGAINLLVFGEVLAQHTTVPHADRQRLQTLVRQGQDAWDSNNRERLRIALGELDELVTAVLGRLTDAGVGRPKDLAGLLRGSSSL